MFKSLNSTEVTLFNMDGTIGLRAAYDQLAYYGIILKKQEKARGQISFSPMFTCLVHDNVFLYKANTGLAPPPHEPRPPAKTRENMPCVPLG